MSRTFTAVPATRQPTPLFIGMVGPSSSGKTFSALRLAVGIQRVMPGPIFVADTENRRATHYAHLFDFTHVDFQPPHGSADYSEMLAYCISQGAKTIIIDSASHEHEGEGGMLEFQEREVERLSKGDAGRAEAVKMLAWAKPKAARRKFLREIVRAKVNIIMLFRAKHISKPVKKDGKTTVIDMGFVPVAGEEFVFEMALSMLMLPGAEGVPTWKPENPGEKLAVKLPIQFKELIRESEKIGEDFGERLAKWAIGDKPIDPAALLAAGKAADAAGNKKQWWASLNAAERAAVTAAAPPKPTQAPEPEKAVTEQPGAKAPTKFEVWSAKLAAGADGEAILRDAKADGLPSSLLPKLEAKARELGLL